MKKKTLTIVAVSAITSVLSVFAFQYFNKSSNHFIHDESQPDFIATSQQKAGSMGYIDFSEAAEMGVPAVVHISTITEGRQVVARDPFDPFGGPGRVYQMPNQVGSGSGVIISSDGYIVTNNHVIQNATKVQVTFNNRDVQIAEVVGTEPAMDLALLKIKGNNYPYLSFGDSDALKLGQWVLAIGYPLNLETTVTAGIVSAKSRSIGINQRNAQNAIESFIQTDAAVNPGNSGGALIDAAGNLVGINTAIASPTGAYAGYSYAIPANLVAKAVVDLKKYGKVQRAYLGVTLVDLDKVNPNQIQQFGLTDEEFKHSKGVFVNDVIPNGAAEKAGIKKGDFITAIDGKEVFSSPQLMESIAQANPKEQVNITYSRKGKERATSLQLHGEKDLMALVQSNRTASTQSSKSNNSQWANAGDSSKLGIKVKDLSKAEAEKLNIKGGVLVTEIENGLLKSNTNIRPGFVIFNINDEEISSNADIEKALKKNGKSLQIAGTYADKGGVYYYNIHR